MEVDSEMYNNLNGAQYRDALELLEQIKADGVERAEVILDIGNGSGNVTKLLGKTVRHARLIGLDVDAGMVDFARKQNADDSTMEFHVQDVSVPWDQLDPALRSLEGQVNLIWSNRVLHWVREEQRPTAAANILRFLAPGGRFYTNITGVSDLNEFFPAAEKKEREKVLKIPNFKEQEENLRRVFEQSGLQKVTLDVLSKQWTYDDDKIIEMDRQCVHYLRRYFRESLTNEEKDEILEKMGYVDLFVNALFTPLGQPPSSENLKLLNYYYMQFRITGVKSESEN